MVKYCGLWMLAVLMMLSLTACEDLYPFLYDDDDDDSGGAVAAAPAGESTARKSTDRSAEQDSDDRDDSPPPADTSGSPGSVPADFAGVVWLHANVSGWAQTASLNAKVSGGNIVLNYDKAHSWPEVSAGGTRVVANPWVFVWENGKWYAATFEWLRKGQTSKPAGTVHGSHIKKAPLDDFVPQSGVRYGFMVSGLARDSTRSVQERSNVDMVTWP
ncbi:MAG: hypothetical protein PHD86_00155 [Kiritimatiellae bacterium]|nr:hypothetical protein [Kiritimatiellia bacterium]